MSVLFQLFLWLKFPSKSIIEEEGGIMPSSDNGNDSSNWDQPLIIAEPDIQCTSISDFDQFLLLACDGLFDVYTPDEIVSFVKENMARHGDTQRCCQVRHSHKCMAGVVNDKVYVF